MRKNVFKIQTVGLSIYHNASTLYFLDKETAIGVQFSAGKFRQRGNRDQQ